MEHPVQNEKQTKTLLNSSNLVANQATPQLTKNLIAVSSIIIIAIYAAAQMLADIGSLKIAIIAGISVDAGTFIYPITFTLRDMIHKKLGKRAARTVVLVCGVINLVMALYFAFITWLSPDPTWQLQEQWAVILGPVWRIVAASISAEVIAELIDTEIYHLWVTKVTTKYQWSRVLVSNFFSVPIDSMIFSFVAFYGDMPVQTVWSIVLANIIVKGAVTIVSIPFIYLVKDDEILYN